MMGLNEQAKVFLICHYFTRSRAEPISYNIPEKGGVRCWLHAPAAIDGLADDVGVADMASRLLDQV